MAYFGVLLLCKSKLIVMSISFFDKLLYYSNKLLLELWYVINLVYLLLRSSKSVRHHPFESGFEFCCNDV